MSTIKKIPTFQSGSKFVIYVDGKELAHVQNLSMSDDMMLAAVGGIGSYSMHATEPLGYAARGSMTITTWSSLSHIADKMPSAASLKSGEFTAHSPNAALATLANQRDGNSFMLHAAFNPFYLLVSSSFDINVYGKIDVGNGASSIGLVEGVNQNEAPNYVIRGCRLASYNMGFSPGSILNESVSFLALAIEDGTTETSKQGGA